MVENVFFCQTLSRFLSDDLVPLLNGLTTGAQRLSRMLLILSEGNMTISQVIDCVPGYAAIFALITILGLVLFKVETQTKSKVHSLCEAFHAHSV